MLFPNIKIPATIEHVIGVIRGTSLGLENVQIHTVEHICSALLGLGKPHGVLLKSPFGALRENDFIYAAGGQALSWPIGFQAFVLGLHPGDKAVFGILRDGVEKEVEVQL